MRRIFFLTAFFISVLSGQSGQAADAPKDLGGLHAFQREGNILTEACAKAWVINFDIQAECKVDLWAADASELFFDPVPLLGLWLYADADFKATVTFNRTVTGYSIRLGTNDAKFKDRLNIKVARKYIESAIQKKNLQKFYSVIARPAPQIKSGTGFTETYKGALQVVTRSVQLARGQSFAQHCQASWDGFVCGANLIRNNHAETLLSDLKPLTLRSGVLKLSVKSYRAWQDGTAFSAVSIVVRANRFAKDFSTLAKDYDALVRQLASVQFAATQIAGDIAPAPTVYAQKLLGNLKALSWAVPFTVEACRATYAYQAGQLRGRCDVLLQMPGVLAQPPQVYWQYLEYNGVGSLVQIAMTPAGWRADFTGEEKNVGKFQAVEKHLTEAFKSSSIVKTRVFLAY